MEKIIAKKENTPELKAPKENVTIFRTVGNIRLANMLDATGERIKHKSGKNVGKPIVYVVTPDGRVLDMKKQNTINEIIRHSLKGAIAYNELKGTTYVRKPLPWNDDANRQFTPTDRAFLYGWIEDEFDIYSKQKIDDAITTAAAIDKYNPLIERLEDIYKNWDGKTGRAEALPMRYLGANDTWVNRAIMRHIMIGMLHRAYEPGCKLDEVPVLIGEQGGGKSSFWRHLALAENDDWYNDNFEYDDNRPDISIMKLQGRWLLEIPEMKAYDKLSQINHLKAFLSQREDVQNVKYVAEAQTKKRSCAFAGSTNNKNFLSDTTGNRRFLCIECHKEMAEVKIGIDESVEDTIKHFEQAWGEIIHVYKTERTTTNLDPKLRDEMEKMQKESFVSSDGRTGLIIEYLCNREKRWAEYEAGVLCRTYDVRKEPPAYICTQEIWQRALGEKGNANRSTSNSICDILRCQIGKTNSIVRIEDAGMKRCGEYGPQAAFSFEILDNDDTPTTMNIEDAFEYVDEEIPF